MARDISQRKRIERLEHNRREILEMVAQNRPLDAVLCRVEEMIELYYPGAVARIIRRTFFVRHAAAGETTAPRRTIRG